VVLSPHTGALTAAAVEKGLEMVVENLRAWLQGTPLRRVV
jgi:phosphoglycerate dehydrogenase-like enzyme